MIFSVLYKGERCLLIETMLTRNGAQLLINYNGPIWVDETELDPTYKPA